MEKEDKRLEQLRDINQKLANFKQLVTEKNESLHASLHVLETETARGNTQSIFVDVNGKKIPASTDLDNLLKQEEILDKLYLLQNKDPVAEVHSLLQAKVKLLKSLLCMP